VLAVDATGFRPIRQAVEHSYESYETVLYLVEDESRGAAEEDDSVSVRQLQVPEQAQREYEKGVAASGKRKMEEAIARFRKAIGLYPDYDEAYIQLSLAHLGQAAYADAQEVLTKAVAVNEKNASAYALLGVAYREQGRLPESTRAFEQSLGLQERSWFAHLELGETLVRMGQVEEAWPHAARAHELNPATPTTHLLLYKTLILRSENAQALTELDEFLRLYPQHPLAARAREKREALAKTVSQAAN
jgi:tetratricopeptide (TPR) repeat protein